MSALIFSAAAGGAELTAALSPAPEVPVTAAVLSMLSLASVSAGPASAVLFLLGCALTDLQKREISLPYTAAFIILGICFCCQTGRPFPDILPALAPGCFLFAVSFITRGAVGGGDGIAAAAAGLFLSPAEAAAGLAAGSMLAALFSGALFLIRRRGRDTIPFLPFFLAGVLLVLLM